MKYSCVLIEELTNPYAAKSLLLQASDGWLTQLITNDPSVTGVVALGSTVTIEIEPAAATGSVGQDEAPAVELRADQPADGR